MLRRQRGGQKLLLEKLWPDLKMIVSVDYRINTTGLYSDYILPAAQHYEKIGNSMPSVHHMNFVLIDKAVDPPNDAMNDYDIGIGWCAPNSAAPRARWSSPTAPASAAPATVKNMTTMAC
jgi:anaerobic selenocysteine-containing dehydrogenase